MRGCATDSFIGKPQSSTMELSYRDARADHFPNRLPFDALNKTEQQGELMEGRLLFQLDAIPDSNIWFGRNGLLFFFMREQDLGARDFSKVWATEQ